MLRLAGRGLGGLLVAGAGSAVVAEQVAPEAGPVRSIRFWRGSVPVFARYKYAEWAAGEDEEDAARRYGELHEKYSPVLKDLTLELQGFFYKLAQVMSTRDEFLPEEYLAWCKELQDQCPKTLSMEEALAVVEGDLGVPADELFAKFEEVPLGAASIGQVHKAELKDGRTVAVKIQYPGMEEKFRSDIAAVKSFCDLLMPQHSPYFNEIKKQFQTEFDYRGEADNLTEVRKNVMDAGYRSVVDMPQPIDEMCSKNVLVMTYLPGEKMITAVKDSFKRLAALQGRDYAEMEAEMMQAMKDGTMEMKSLNQSSSEMSRTSFLLWWYDFVRNVVVFSANWTVAPLIGANYEYYHSERPIDLAWILEKLLRVHGDEIFQGAFNADPHPGNVLLMPDGRLGLVDYGQVKRLSPEVRDVFAKLVIALSRDDREEIIRLMTDEVGFKTRDGNPEVIWRSAAFWNDRDTDDVTMGLNVHLFSEWLDTTDPVEVVNDEFIMVARVSILLRGVANAFGLKVRVTDFWKDSAAAYLKQRGIDY